MFTFQVEDHYGNHRCLEEKNDLIAYTLSNRGQDGAYGLGIETTSFSCLKVTMFLIKSRTSKCIHPQHPTDGMAVMNVSNKAGDQFVSFLLLLLRVHYPVGATEQNGQKILIDEKNIFCDALATPRLTQAEVKEF